MTRWGFHNKVVGQRWGVCSVECVRSAVHVRVSAMCAYFELPKAVKYEGLLGREGPSHAHHTHIAPT